MNKSAAHSIANGLSVSLRSAAIVIAGVALMALSAKVQVPFWPVPMNLQVLAVMGFAIGLGPRMAVTIFAAYLASGASGLPVFAGSPERGIGIVYMAGPTGGYLIGMLAASWVTGMLGATRGLMGRTAAMLAGLAVIYGLGVAWLALYIPAGHLLAAGILPFVLGDLVKIGIVAAVASATASIRHSVDPQI